MLFLDTQLIKNSKDKIMAQLFSNNASTTLSAGINNTVTSIAVTNGSVFQSPTGGDFELLTITDGTNWEVVKVTARATNTLTVVRGFEGTAQSWNSGAKVEGRVTKSTLNRLIQNNATGTNAVATGPNASATGQSSVSLGDSSAAASDYAIAIGNAAKVGSVASWQASTAYATGNLVKATTTNNVFVCLNGGTSGTTEPTWGTTVGATTTDGGTGLSWGWLDADTFPTCTDSIAIGHNSAAVSYRAIAVGLNALSVHDSVAVGYRAQCLGGFSLAMGLRAYCYGWDSIAIGELATVTAGTGYGNIAIGPFSEVNGSNNYSIAIGADVVNRLNDSYVIAGMPLICKDYFFGSSVEHLYFTGSQAIVFSKEIDLKTLADDAATITITTGATFFPDEVGLVITSASGVTGQPNVSFGITGNTTAVLASTPTTKSAAKGRDIYTPAKDGVNSLTASVKTAATGTTLLGRFYWKGILVEDE